MADTGVGPGWSEAQWDAVQSAVTDAFNKASIASQLLPCYGPLGASVEAVRREELNAPTQSPPTLTVTDDTTVKLFNLTVRVELSTQQAAEESLSAALVAFRRAANILAQAEDRIVFQGYKSNTDDAVTKAIVSRAGGKDPRSNVVVSSPDDSLGLVDFHDPANAQKKGGQPPKATRTGSLGKDVVRQVASSIAALETQSNPGPFAAVLGMELFEAAYTPNGRSMILPADRITPLLNGPLLRSSMMPNDTGVVVSMSANAIDILVATPPKVQFLQTTSDAKLMFRVYERFTLRNRQPLQPGVTAFRLAKTHGAPRQASQSQQAPSSGGKN